MQLERRVLSTHRTSPTSARVESATIARTAVVHSPTAHPTTTATNFAVSHQRGQGQLPRLLASRSSEVARAVSEAVAAQLAGYGGVVGGERSRCLITAVFEPLIESAVTGEPYSDRELNRFRELGARAAFWKLQLADLTTAFNVALAAAHREFWSMAPPEDFVEMAQVTARCSRMAELARGACVEGFVGPRPQGADARLARKLLAERLIAGDWDADPARLKAIGVDVAPGYLVLACESGTDESVWTTDESIWTKVEDDLSKLRGVLYLLAVDPSHATNPSTLIVLLPAESDADAVRVAHTAADLVDRISDLADCPVYAAQAYRPGLPNLPAAVEEARRMLPVIKAIPDAQVKPYRTDDLLVELALVQQPSIRHRLAGLIEPLNAGTGLRRTLEVLLACNLDRERAASELCIHRRTLYYRMDRIRKLSGIDPNTAHGIQLLRAALTSARMRELETPDPTPAPVPTTRPTHAAHPAHASS